MGPGAAVAQLLLGGGPTRGPGQRRGEGQGSGRVRSWIDCSRPGEFCGLSGGGGSPEAALAPAADLAPYGGGCRGGGGGGRGRAPPPAPAPPPPDGDRFGRGGGPRGGRRGG